jgi:hypothetical protein
MGAMPEKLKGLIRYRENLAAVLDDKESDPLATVFLITTITFMFYGWIPDAGFLLSVIQFLVCAFVAALIIIPILAFYLTYRRVGAVAISVVLIAMTYSIYSTYSDPVRKAEEFSQFTWERKYMVRLFTAQVRVKEILASERPWRAKDLATVETFKMKFCTLNGKWEYKDVLKERMELCGDINKFTKPYEE